MVINKAEAIQELTRLHAIYEQALVENDVETLDSLFWDSERAVRYGAGENLYGIAEVRAFRRARAKLNLARTTGRIEITTLNDSVGIINLEFVRPINGVNRHGRQSQFWMKMPEGWKIVSAHVSFLSTALSAAGSYVAEASQTLGLPIAASDQESVELEFQRITSVAHVLLRFPVDQMIETAATFTP